MNFGKLVVVFCGSYVSGNVILKNIKIIKIEWWMNLCDKKVWGNFK